MDFFKLFFKKYLKYALMVTAKEIKTIVTIFLASVFLWWRNIVAIMIMKRYIAAIKE